MVIKFQTARITDGRANIPAKKGIYMWVRKKSKEIVYIGITTSRFGLHRRINLQHLNPKYLEYRKERQTIQDRYQIQFAITQKNEEKSCVIKGIDKSVFRRAIGRKHMIKPGQSTVNFILKKFDLKYFCLSNEVDIKRLEKNLINQHQPIYNTTYRS